MKIKKRLSLFLLILPVFSALAQTETTFESGIASFYHDKFVGRKTASGERFSQKALTCAHKNLPFGTRLKVTNLENGKSVVVTVNDRGPFKGHRIIDLSKRAASVLGFVKDGLTKVTVEILPEEITPTEKVPDYLVLNDSLRAKYFTNQEKPFSINMGRFETEDQMQQMAMKVNQELDRQVIIQTIPTRDDTAYLVFVGIFYRQDEAENYLDLIENYYPKAEVTELGASAL